MNYESIKDSLKRKGWSYRRAAKYLGCHYMHLYMVVSGKRESKALTQRIKDLPNSSECKK